MAKRKKRPPPKGPGTPPSPRVATGGEVAAPPTRLANGTLVGQPGSNGGVHRGPDLKPRAMMQAILLKAYSDEGYVAPELAPGQPRKKVDWRKVKKLRHAAVLNASRTVQRILYASADGVVEAFAPAIRIIQVTHEVMQPGKDEAKSTGVPFGPRFTRPPQQPPVSSEAAAEQPVIVDETG